MSPLPGGWTEAKLAAIADVVRGVTYNKKDARSSAADGYLPILRATNINDGLSLDSEKVYVPESCVRPDQRMRPGDVLVAASSGSASVVGKSAQLRGSWDGGFGAFCTVVRPHLGIDPKYVAHFVASPRVRKSWRALAQGTNINNLKSSDLANTCVPIPPIQEQERIAAVIEEQFSRLEAGVAALERARANLKRMRAAVLQAVVAEWSDPTVGATRSLGEVISFLDQGWSPRCERTPRPDENSWGVIKTSAVQPMRFEAEANKGLPAALAPRPAYELAGGDLLITRAGPRARAGVCCLVRRPPPRLMICDKVYRFRAAEHLALPDYLEIILNAPSVMSSIDEIKTGISDSGVNITQTTFRDLTIPLPPIDIQAGVVATVQEMLTRIATLEATLETVAVRGRRLRSATLAAAFAGLLVPQDPTDEPAPDHLTRIAAARGSSPTSRATTPRRGELKVTAA